MEFFNSAIEVLQTLVVALGAGLGVWGAINLLEGYGNDNPGSKSQGIQPLPFRAVEGQRFLQAFGQAAGFPCGGQAAAGWSGPPEGVPQCQGQDLQRHCAAVL